MRFRLTFLFLAFAVLAAAFWVQRDTRPNPGYWAQTGSGCYVPIQAPTNTAPGPVCGTPPALPYCVFQGRQYAPTERFAAGDGCNSCECDPETMSVVCTEMACGNVSSE